MYIMGEDYWEFCMYILTYGCWDWATGDMVCAGELNKGRSVQMLDSGPPPAPRGAPSWELSAHKPFDCGHRKCLQQGPALWNVKQDQIDTLTMQTSGNEVPLQRSHSLSHFTQVDSPNKATNTKWKVIINTHFPSPQAYKLCGKVCDFFFFPFFS